MKQYVGISRDHSGSMSFITKGAMKDYNQIISDLREAAKEHDVDTIVSVVKCGVGQRATVDKESVNSSVAALKTVTNYVADGGGTPLWDSVGLLIDMLSAAPDADDPQVSFLVMVITDGLENRSVKWNAHTLGAKIKALQATDRWTFVFRVPVGNRRTIEQLGVYAGNIAEWEQTEKGFHETTVIASSGLRSYYTARASGATGTSKFFADMSGVSSYDLKQNVGLHDISKKCKLFHVPPNEDGIMIRTFIENRVGSYVLGGAFYQLTKPETVQASKVICIYDRKTKAIYSGDSVRGLLGLPLNGDIRLTAGILGDYDVFVQSSSVNRKLVGNTLVLYAPFMGR